MKMIVEGVMHGNLPWGMIAIGAFAAITVEILGIPVLPVAIGLYLPLELSTPIMVGGIIKWIVDKKKGASEGDAGKGVLFCSGMIAGEGLVGIVLAVLAVVGLESKIDLSSKLDTGWIGALVVLALVSFLTYHFAMKKDEKVSTDNKDEK